jgi:hypothetical protein
MMDEPKDVMDTHQIRSKHIGRDIRIREVSYIKHSVMTIFMRRVRRKQCFQKWKLRDSVLRMLYASDLTRFPWVLEANEIAIGDKVETSCPLCPGAVGSVVRLGCVRRCMCADVTVAGASRHSCLLLV